MHYEEQKNSPGYWISYCRCSTAGTSRQGFRSSLLEAHVQTPVYYWVTNPQTWMETTLEYGTTMLSKYFIFLTTDPVLGHEQCLAVLDPYCTISLISVPKHKCPWQDNKQYRHERNIWLLALKLEAQGLSSTFRINYKAITAMTIVLSAWAH